MEKRYLVFILAFLGAFLLFNSNIQGNVVRIAPSQQSLTLAPPAGPIATPQQIICPFTNDEVVYVTANSGSTLPFNAATVLNNVIMPNALKSTNIGGSVLTQAIGTNGNFVFGMNDAPLDFASFFFHLDEGEKLATYDFIFTPPLVLQVGQAWYLLGRYYTLTYAAVQPGSGLLRIVLQGCADQYGNAPILDLYGDSNPNQLFVKINGEVIEDVVGKIVFSYNVANQLQINQIQWVIILDTPPGYNNLDMADGDQQLIYMLDEPQALLGLDAALDVTPVNSATCGTQYIIDLGYSLLY